MKEFPLTIKQAREFFEGEQKRTGNLKAPVGESCTDNNCPLVQAYLHFHPGARIIVTKYMATIDGVVYKIADWQEGFVHLIDTPACDEVVTADMALAILELVTEQLGGELMNFFPLTRKQARDYFVYEQKAQGKPDAVVGLASHSLDCPLIRAYRHYHPEDTIELWPGQAIINLTRYSLRDWQTGFISETDANEHGRPVGADEALDTLGVQDE